MWKLPNARTFKLPEETVKSMLSSLGFHDILLDKEALGRIKVMYLKVRRKYIWHAYSDETIRKFNADVGAELTQMVEHQLLKKGKS